MYQPLCSQQTTLDFCNTDHGGISVQIACLTPISHSQVVTDETEFEGYAARTVYMEVHQLLHVQCPNKTKGMSNEWLSLLEDFKRDTGWTSQPTNSSLSVREHFSRVWCHFLWQTQWNRQPCSAKSSTMNWGPLSVTRCHEWQTISNVFWTASFIPLAISFVNTHQERGALEGAGEV